MPVEIPPTIEFGFPIPQVFLDGRADMNLVRRVLALGERLGFHSAWVQDQVAGDVPMHESLTLMSYAAALTTRVRLGVSVLVFPIRNAVHVAKIVSTLDNLSNGRIILGIGLGHVMVEEFFRTYCDNREALRRFNEGVAVMKSLWTRPRTDCDGEFSGCRRPYAAELRATAARAAGSAASTMRLPGGPPCRRLPAPARDGRFRGFRTADSRFRRGRARPDNAASGARTAGMMTGNAPSAARRSSSAPPWQIIAI